MCFNAIDKFIFYLFQAFVVRFFKYILQVTDY